MDRICLRKVKKLHANKVSCPWENVNNDVKNVHNGYFLLFFRNFEWMIRQKMTKEQKLK